jgi:capsular polysaccharide biosynthesis protein
MDEHVMDVRSSTVFLRQRWRALAAAGAVGVALGALYVALVPAQLGSTAVVLLPAASGSPGEEGTETQVRIVLSTPVLEKAGKSVTPVLSASEVNQRIKVEATTSQLVEIRASSRSARQAQALSQAVAEAYITTLLDSARSVADVAVGDLRSREAALTEQLEALQTEIDATTERAQGEDAKSLAGSRDGQLLAQLTAEQADISLQLDQVKSDLATYEMPGGASETHIIQPAAPATVPSLLRRLITGTFIGALLAVAGAALVLLIRRRRDPRVYARDDLADAVGSSVLAGVRSRPQRSVAEWLAFFETYEASAVEAWAFRQMLRALVTPSDSRALARTGTKRIPGRVEHPRSLTVIAISGDQRGVAVGPQLAVFAASLGIATRFIVASGHDSAASLCAACATDRSSQLRTGLVLEAGTEGAPLAQDGSPAPPGDTSDGPVNGQVVNEPRETAQDTARETQPAAEPQQEPTHRSVDLTIVLAVADREEPTLQEVPATAVTVLAISPGVGTREDLARLAVAVDDAGRRIDGIVVADPDPSDRTTGRRTLDERALQAPLPVRMTGPSRVSAWASGRGKAR